MHAVDADPVGAQCGQRVAIEPSASSLSGTRSNGRVTVAAIVVTALVVSANQLLGAVWYARRSDRSAAAKSVAAAADKRLRDELASCEFNGQRYRRFEEKLARHGMSVLLG